MLFPPPSVFQSLESLFSSSHPAVPVELRNCSSESFERKPLFLFLPEAPSCFVGVALIGLHQKKKVLTRSALVRLFPSFLFPRQDFLGVSPRSETAEGSAIPPNCSDFFDPYAFTNWLGLRDMNCPPCVPQSVGVFVPHS